MSVSIPSTRRPLIVALALAILLAGATGRDPRPVRAAAPDLAWMEQEAVYIGNLRRAAHGLPPLRMNGRIKEAARWFAADLTKSGGCQHQSSDGLWPGDRDGRQGRVGRAGYRGVYGAENVMCGATSAEAAIDAFYNELPPNDGHRLNLLDPNSLELGIGVYRDARGDGRLVQDFGRDLSAPPLIIALDAPWSDRAELPLYLHGGQRNGGLDGSLWNLGLPVAMQLGESFDLRGATWQPFRADAAWTFTPGDGQRHLFARLRDAVGRSVVVHDSIWHAVAAPPAGAWSLVDETSVAEVALPVDPARGPRIQAGLGARLDQSSFEFLGGVGGQRAVPGARDGQAFCLGGGAETARAWAWFAPRVLPAGRPLQAVLRLRLERGDAAEVSVTQTVNDQRQEHRLDAATAVADGWRELSLDFTDQGKADQFLTWQLEAGDGAVACLDDLRIFDRPMSSGGSPRWRHPSDNYRAQGLELRYLDAGGRLLSEDVCYVPMPGWPGGPWCQDGAPAAPGSPDEPLPTLQPTQAATQPAPRPTSTVVVGPLGRDGMPLVFVPEGAFLQGADAADRQAAANERPQRRVYVDAFHIDQTEVTNALFARFVSATGYRSRAEQDGFTHGFVGAEWRRIDGGSWRNPEGPGSGVQGREAEPVLAVSWQDADAYCRWAGRRLPTEAEWEKAARGVDGRRFPWGPAPADGGRANLADRRTPYAWREALLDDGFERAAPAGSYPAGASPWGALDMAGNAWEWTADWYDPRAYDAPGDRNPSGPASGTQRVLRGGGYSDDAAHLRSSRRSADEPGYSANDGGFRCAQSAAAAPPTAVPSGQPPRPSGRVLYLPLALHQPRPTPTPTPTPTDTPSATPSLPAPPPPTTAVPPEPDPGDPEEPDLCASLGEDYGDWAILGEPSDRPAEDHPDLNLRHRGWIRVQEDLGLVDVGGETDDKAPRLVELLGRRPDFVGTYAVRDWDWSEDRRGQPISRVPVTLLGLGTHPGEVLHAPSSGRPISPQHAVLVLYAADDQITLKYTLEDNVVDGYTLHLLGLCVDPDLLRIYRDHDRAGRRRQVALRPGQGFGRARGGETRLAIRDKGSFMDPRSRKDWWPGLTWWLGLR